MTMASGVVVVTWKKIYHKKIDDVLMVVVVLQNVCLILEGRDNC